MSRWLVGSRIEAESQHMGTFILRSDDVGSSISIWHVIPEELALEGTEDVNAMGGQSQRVDGRRGDRVSHHLSAVLGGRSLVLHRCEQAVCNGVISHDGCCGLGADIDHIISEQCESVPIPMLIRIGGRDIDGRPETSKDGLDWPFELGHEDILIIHKDPIGLESMNSDQGESNSLDVDVMALIPTSPRAFPLWIGAHPIQKWRSRVRSL